jgi:IS5 family transposase
VFYSIRSERQLMEQTQYNLLFRWFIGLAMDDAVWVPTVFTKNLERLIEHDAVIELFNRVSIGCWSRPTIKACSRASTSAWTERSKLGGSRSLDSQR